MMNQDTLLPETKHTPVLRNLPTSVATRQVGPSTSATPIEVLETNIRAELTASLSKQIREELLEELQARFEQQLQQKLAEQQQRDQQQRQAEQTDTQRIETLLQKLSEEISNLKGETNQAASPVLWDNTIILASILLGKLLPRLASDPAELQALINQAVSDLQHEDLVWHQMITVYLHPQDLKTLETKHAAFIGQLERTNIRLQSSSHIELGGCLASCASESLDSRLETQLEQIKQAMLAWRRTQKPSTTSLNQADDTLNPLSQPTPAVKPIRMQAS